MGRDSAERFRDAQRESGTVMPMLTRTSPARAGRRGLSLVEWLLLALVAGLLLGLGGWWLSGHGYAAQVAAVLLVCNWVLVVGVPVAEIWTRAATGKWLAVSSLWLLWALAVYRLWATYTTGS